MERKKYPVGPEHYTIYEEVGRGISCSVHRALCIPQDEIVAIKILDFERGNSNLNNICREAQTMILVDHPNVLQSHCSFVSDHTLWVVIPFMSGGSCLHILKATHPDGFEEVVIATILKAVLRALEYLHDHGHIHRDVKAGNILISGCGAIKLGDFGVSAFLFDSGDRQRMRNTFVGTPCWMAPEVMEQLHGYDFKADVWSFGITALELAHGHAPFSKFPPMKVLLMTLQNAPPSLNYERDKKFSKSFRQMIASCLVKDPSKRPTATKLLRHHFFKQARSNDYITRKLLDGLPVLGDRIKDLKKKDEDMLAQKKVPDGKMEEISQNEYKRGISGWNFDLEDVKAQASSMDDQDFSSCQNGFDVCKVNERLDDDSSTASSNYENYVSQNPSPLTICERNNIERTPERQISDAVDLPPQSDKQSTTGTEDAAEKYPTSPSVHGDETDEKIKMQVVHRKGRFKVMSENLDLEKVSPLLQRSPSTQQKILSRQSSSTQSHPGSSVVLPLLHSILHANIAQRASVLFHSILLFPNKKGKSGEKKSKNRTAYSDSSSTSPRVNYLVTLLYLLRIV